MDAISDDSDIYNIEYVAKDLGKYSKELVAQYYQTTVNHPMSTIYRKSAVAKGFEMTHELDTEMQGAKIKNSFDLDNHTITGGLDYSLRNWDGGYYKNGVPLPVKKFHSIWDVDTENYALFLKDEITMDKLVLDIGLRYDTTDITSDNPKQQDNDYDELNGYLFATYHADENTKYFGGFGKSSRVPDAKELYWIGSMGNPIGTPDLDDTINYEFDLGVEMSYDDFSVKLKGFYSMLDDYIAYNASNVNKMGAAQNAYENVDADIYGFELSGTYVASEAVYFDYGMSYQRGKKDDPLKGQFGTDMPEIPPFKMNLAGTYDWDETLALRAELIVSDDWSDYDGENGEQELSGYGVLNLRGTKEFGENFELIVGIDNLFDKTYAVSNTYKDLILLGTPGETIMLMNEPGRYVYTNLKFRF
jgi:iron complex outermembrane receptor protein